MFSTSGVLVLKTISKRPVHLRCGVFQIQTLAPFASKSLFVPRKTNENLVTKQLPQHDWNRAVSEAEKIVGYPTSFLSLRWILSDEIANIALHVRKLVGSNHPLLKTAKYLMHNGKSSTQAWGLIVLLISKAAGHSKSIPEIEQDKSAGVLHSQRALAEITEMIRISQLIQRSLVNLQSGTEIGQDVASLSDMSFGNKISILTGDYLLAKSCAELSNLRNQELIELMLSAIRDFTESEFFGERDEQNNPIPSKPQNEKITPVFVDEDYVEPDQMIPYDVKSCLGIAEKEWELRHILSAGSLLGKSCQGSLKLALQPDEVQKQGYLFGKHLSLAWQTCLDVQPFREDVPFVDTSFSLVSAPVLFHLDYDHSLYKEIEKGKTSVDCIDYNLIRNEVIRGPGLEKTWKLKEKHTNAAMRVLEKFPPSDGRTALTNILLAMREL